MSRLARIRFMTASRVAWLARIRFMTASRVARYCLIVVLLIVTVLVVVVVANRTCPAQSRANLLGDLRQFPS